jgi:DNA polymerase III subunit alpha
VDILCFSESFKRLSEKLKLDVPVLVKGSVRIEEGSNPKLVVSDITPLDEAQPKLARSLRIKVPLEMASQGTVDALHAICTERKGEAKVLFDLERKGDFTVVMEAEGYNVLPDRAFIDRVEELCGRGSVRIND